MTPTRTRPVRVRERGNHTQEAQYRAVFTNTCGTATSTAREAERAWCLLEGKHHQELASMEQRHWPSSKFGRVIPKGASGWGPELPFIAAK